MSIKNPTSSTLLSSDDHPIIEVSRKRVVVLLINIPKQRIFFLRKLFRPLVQF